MNRKLIITLAIAVVTLALAGCPHQAPVYNVNNATVVTNVNNVSSEQVRQAIIRAGGGLGWIITEVGPGELEGTLNLRSHTAKVSIPYSTKSYSIIYKDSVDLDYNGETIHSNYNGWVQNLQKAIQVQLTQL
jgi:uncharacterized lipoprotein NlpE involved in copper resistance